MYDHIVAGGQPYGITPIDNVIKECEEEASIPIELAKLAKPAGEGSQAMRLDKMRWVGIVSNLTLFYLI